MYRKKVFLSIGAIIILITVGIAAFAVAIRPASAAIRVACVGDSITEGSGYPYKLRLLLGENYEVGNFGVSGSTASPSSAIPYMRQTEFQEALKFDPDIIIIMLGTNDANPEINYNNNQDFEEGYRLLINSFLKLDGEEQVYIVKSPPILTLNSGYNNSILVNTVIPHIDNVANDLNLPTIDIYNTIGENPDYFWDGVHPNVDGADIIASTVYDAIT